MALEGEIGRGWPTRQRGWWSGDVVKSGGGNSWARSGRGAPLAKACHKRREEGMEEAAAVVQL